MNRAAAILSIWLLAACGDPASTPSASRVDTVTPVTKVVSEPDTTTLAGTWYLQPVLASDSATGKLPFLRFEISKTHIYGNTGCNNLTGVFWYSDKDSSLSFNEKFVTTKMSCTGYNEQAFLKSLLSTNHYRLKKGMLILLSDQTELSRWTRKINPAPKTGKA
jgi:heat shock protein HslJ